jgi:hypothetical protein
MGTMYEGCSKVATATGFAFQMRIEVEFDSQRSRDNQIEEHSSSTKGLTEQGLFVLEFRCLSGYVQTLLDFGSSATASTRSSGCMA